MSADVLTRPDGPLDAWITGGDHYLPAERHTYYTTSTPNFKMLDRPKLSRSVPPTLTGGRSVRKDSHTSSSNTRPKTAIGATRTECERVFQVEHEATRKQNLDTHLPVKKIKPPPWQKVLDVPPVPCAVGPGYVISRSKSKVAMTIKTDDFFDPIQEQVVQVQDQNRDPLVAQLRQQIDDLTLYLEEERLNHRDTKRKAADQLRDRLEESTRQHENSLRLLEQQLEEKVEAMQKEHRQEMDSLTDASEGELTKMRGEVEFLQGAFESYKSQVHQETDERWKKREAELLAQQENALHDKLKELRSRVHHERSTEKADLAAHHQREMMSLKQEHKKEINQLLRRFSSASKELELLQETREQLKETQQDMATLKEDYDHVCHQVAEVTRELTDAKVQLVTFEQTFQDRVQAIDDKYKDQIHELMAQNTELRRLYMQKCEELYDEKAESEKSRIDSLETAKDTMKFVIETRHEAMVNLAATDAEFEKRIRPPKERPVSAPYTKSETHSALLSAGETDAFIKRREERRRRPETCKPRILEQIAREREATGDGGS